LGFFFACIIPELRNGDVLRLQYLNNVELDPASLVLYSDSARALLDAILADRLGNKIGGLPGPEQT
jgi:serine/threonine-protein kinase RsbW